MATRRRARALAVSKIRRNYDGYFNLGAGDNNNSGTNNDDIIRGDGGDDT
jgi:hypothetical protein